MVALKQVPLGCRSRRSNRKQERRGGIETMKPQLDSMPEEEKQERRGGIETRARAARSASWGSKQERRGGIETLPPERITLGVVTKQ